MGNWFRFLGNRTKANRQWGTMCSFKQCMIGVDFWQNFWHNLLRDTRICSTFDKVICGITFFAVVIDSFSNYLKTCRTDFDSFGGRGRGAGDFRTWLVLGSFENLGSSSLADVARTEFIIRRASFQLFGEFIIIILRKWGLTVRRTEENLSATTTETTWKEQRILSKARVDGDSDQIQSSTSNLPVTAGPHATNADWLPHLLVTLPWRHGWCEVLLIVKKDQIG